MGLRRLLKDNMAVSVDVAVCLEVAFGCFSGSSQICEQVQDPWTLRQFDTALLVSETLWMKGTASKLRLDEGFQGGLRRSTGWGLKGERSEHLLTRLLDMRALSVGSQPLSVVS